MRFSTLLTCLGASALAMVAHAQDMQGPPTGDPMGSPPGAEPLPGDMPPPPTTPPGMPPGSTTPGPDAMPPTSPPPPPPPPSSPPAAPGGQIEMMPPRAVEQSAPQPPADYPVCSREVKDGCRNPGSR